MNEDLLILTPEKTVITLTPARMGSRFLAAIIDFIVLIALLMAVLLFFSFLSAGAASMRIPPEALMGFGYFTASFLFFGYYFLQEIFMQGRTLGKMVMGLRTIMVDGTPLTTAAAVYRTLLLPGDLLPGIPIVGLTLMALTEKSQRVGDLAAGTMVIHDVKARFSFNPAPHRAGLNRFEQHLPDLRAMTIEEYQAIKRLTDRFPELPPSTQARSVAEIWEPFALKYGIDAIPNVHPVYLMEAVVVKYGRENKLI